MTGFRPTRQTRLYEDVAAQLREAILSGEFPPGGRLPAERELMSTFGVSRAVVRQATMNLEHEGLVEVQVGAGGGTFVLESGIETVCRGFEILFRHRRVQLVDYLAAKRILEPALSDAIFANSDQELHERLQDNLERFRVALRSGAERPALTRLSLEFHEMLAQGTSNPVLEALMIPLVRAAEQVPAFKTNEASDWGRILREHEELVHLLRARRGARFRRLMAAHLDTVESIYDGVAEAPPPEPAYMRMLP